MQLMKIWQIEENQFCYKVKIDKKSYDEMAIHYQGHF